MRSNLIYDLPTRIFHWLFAGLFIVSFVITKTTDDESMAFSYHMLTGLLLGALVLWRIIWGLVGSKHARFSGFKLNPADLKDYFLGIFSGSKKRWSGHNPASSWAAITMFVLALGLAVTGYLMTTGNKEAFEDVHEFMANSFIVVVALHVSGVLFHTIRHQDGIALSIVDGKKAAIEEGGSIPSARPFAGVLLIALTLPGAISLYKNFDSQNKTLQAFGQMLQLGENEENESHHESGEGEDDDDGDDD